MVYFCSNTMAAEKGVDGKSEIEGGTAGGHRLDLSLWRKDEDLAGKEIEFDGVEEIHGIGLRVVENFLDGTEPVVQLCLILCVFFVFQTVLVFPMSGKSLFCHLIHTVGTNLYFYPLACLGHQCHVQGLIAIGLRMTEPVAQTVWMRLVDFGDGDVDVETLVDLFFPDFRREDDTDGKDVIYIFEGHMLVLHLAPYRIRCLDALLDLVVDAHLVKRLFDGSLELFKEQFALL